MSGVGGMYREGRERLTQLVPDLASDEAAAPVPACPAWTVHDVIAHLAGSCADVLAGNHAGMGRRPGEPAARRTMAELVEELSTIAPQLEAVADQFLPESGPSGSST